MEVKSRCKLIKALPY